MAVSKDHYYRLASNLPKERIQAATALIEELSAENSDADFKYALQRLITGLASGHDSARIGFSMCLTELISLLGENTSFQYTSQKFLVDLESYLNKSIKAKTKGKNLRAFLFGKIFGIQSLINSSLLLNADNNQLLQIIDELFAIALTKSWIREISIVTIVKLINKLNLSTDKSIIPYVLSKLSEYNLILSMDGILIYLNIPSTLRKSFSDLANLSNSQHWKNDDPLTKGNLPLLKDAFHERLSISDENDDENDMDDKKLKNNNNSIQKGSWSPQLHYVWIPLLVELIDNEDLANNDSDSHKSKKQKSNSSNRKKSSNNSKITLSTFWPTFDATFFSNNASSERKHTGFQILELVFKLPSFKSEYYLILFDKNLTRCLINHVSKKDRVLHNLSLKVLSNAVTTAKNNPNARLFLIRALERQCVLFDKVTKTKTIRDCLSSISNDNETNLEIDLTTWTSISSWLLEDCEAQLTSEVNKNEDLSDFKHDIHIFILDSLLNLVRGNKKLIRSIINTENNNKILILEFVSNAKNILEYLANLIYIKQDDELNESIIKTSKDRLQSILSDLMECSKGTIDWSGLIVEVLIDAEKKNQLISSIDNSDEDLNRVKEESFEIWYRLNEKIKNDSLDDSQLRIKKCLMMLLSTALLELYGGDSESFGILNDLINVYNDLDSDSNRSNILNTLIDLMLSYTTQKSGLKKRIGSNIWESIVFAINKEQLERLFEVLMTRENKSGMEQLFNQAVEGYEEDDEEEEDEEEEHNTDNDNDNEIEESDEDEDSGESESESDDDDTNDTGDRGGETDDKDKIEEVEKSTTSALAKALNISEPEKESGDDIADDDDDDDDEEDGYESDESMSDEQMLAIDSQLSAIFKQRQDSLNDIKSSSKNGNERKLEAKEARELMALCKLRVLDLLDSYVTIHFKKSECVLIALVLLEVMELTIDLKVGEKAHKLIKKICKNPFEIKDEENLSSSFELIEQVLKLASKAKFNALSQACSQISIYIIRSIVAYDDKKYEQFITQVTGIYQQHLIQWSINTNDKTSQGIFTDLINWLNSKRSTKKEDF